MRIIESVCGEPMLTLERAEYWRREVAEAVASAAKHGAPEHIDNVLQAMTKEVYECGYSAGIHA